jgi:cell wall assembly regulator SMI1
MWHIRFFPRHAGVTGVDHVERAFNMSLPPGYREFLIATNGGVCEPNSFQIVISKQSSGVQAFFGVDGSSNNLFSLHETMKGRVPNGVLPIASAEGGNLVMIDTRPEGAGRVFFWDHEFETEREKESALFLVAESFEAFIDSLRPFGPRDVQLDAGQVKRAWIDPAFLKANTQRKSD